MSTIKCQHTFCPDVTWAEVLLGECTWFLYCEFFFIVCSIGEKTYLSLLIKIICILNRNQYEVSAAKVIQEVTFEFVSNGMKSTKLLHSSVLFRIFSPFSMPMHLPSRWWDSIRYVPVVVFEFFRLVVKIHMLHVSWSTAVEFCCGRVLAFPTALFVPEWNSIYCH